ncbi:MAG: ABC-2 transporter permease [Clostridium sp.]|jgi:hypothetical protein|nr:ABC-2 transporter permease [Clostridium sp.]
MMISLLKREWIVSRKMMAIAILFLTVCLTFAVYQLCNGKYDESASFISSFPFMIILVSMSRPFVIETRDEVNKFLKLLPVRTRCIVMAKFLFFDSLYLFLSILFWIISHILSAVFQDSYPFSMGLTLMQFSLGLFLVNFNICGYYVFGGENMQYVSILGFVIVIFSGLYVAKIPAVLSYLILPLSALVFSILFAILACMAFRSNKPLWNIGFGRALKRRF